MQCSASFFRVQLLQALRVEISTFQIGVGGVIIALFLVPGQSDHIDYILPPMDYAMHPNSPGSDVHMSNKNGY